MKASILKQAALKLGKLSAIYMYSGTLCTCHTGTWQAQLKLGTKTKYMYASTYICTCLTCHYTKGVGPIDTADSVSEPGLHLIPALLWESHLIVCALWVDIMACKNVVIHILTLRCGGRGEGGGAIDWDNHPTHCYRETAVKKWQNHF